MLERLYRGLAPMLPGDPSSLVDLVTTDYVAAGIVALRNEPGASRGVFHLCAGQGAIPLGDLIDACFRYWAADPAWRRRCVMPPALADLATYRLFEQTVDEVASPSLRRITKALSYFAPQLAYSKRFDTTNSDRMLGAATPVVELLPHIARGIAEAAA